MQYILNFLISVTASVVGYYICRWLDGNGNGNYPKTGSLHRTISTPREEGETPAAATVGVSFCDRFYILNF